MIRRGFWLAVGAASGIYGYRRVSAVGRRLSASLNPAPPAALGQGPRSAQSARRAAIKAARETYRFTRDVREGMDLYTERHSAAASPTLATDQTLATAQTLATDQTMTHEPKDGH
ncbi:MAG TPA: hypothetical protein VKU77_12970 [Streptosporangiaceae bacterium]|nr:hypothetical protein [Streptosporangiaceae bacterium]